MATRVVGVEPVLISGLDVIQGVLPAAHIQGIAVRQEGATAQLLDVIRHHPGIVRAQEGQVAHFPEVNFDGREFILKINAVHAGSGHQFIQLIQQGRGVMGTQIGKIHLGCAHVFSSYHLP